MPKISIGSVMDSLLEGGLDSDVVTTLYGPAGSGKSCLAMAAAATIARFKKVIYIDTEGGFSVERFLQISDRQALENVMVWKITSFKEQEEAFKKLNKIINDKVGLIVVDTVAMLYRVALGTRENVKEVNRSMGLQLSLLVEIARKKHIPSIIISHVYADFDKPESVKLIGGDLLKYSSKCIIELEKIRDGGRIAIIRKHRAIEENKEIKFKIVGSGLIQA